MEEQIEANIITLLEQVKEFQNYLAKQEVSEKNEARQLKAEQNELEVSEQQLLHTTENDEDDDEMNE